MPLNIELWSWDEPRFDEWEALAEETDLTYIIALSRQQQIEENTHFLAALLDGRLVGLLLFIVQPIGPEMDVPVVTDREGQPLLEAKIRAFHVLEQHRNGGVGMALQKKALEIAPTLGCYQVRSRSELDKGANYSIKLKLGFAMHPANRTFRDGTKSGGVYWVKCV